MSATKISPEERNRILFERNHKETMTALTSLMQRPGSDEGTKIMAEMLEKKLNQLIDFAQNMKIEVPEQEKIDLSPITKGLADGLDQVKQKLDEISGKLTPTEPKDMEIHFTRDTNHYIKSPVQVKYKQ